MSNRERARSALFFGVVGFTLAMALLVVPYFSKIGAFEPIPYRVTKTEWRMDDGHIIAKVSFIKDRCEFDQVIARGVFFDEVDPRLIPITNMDTKIGDRLEGLQTVRLRLGPLEHEYEAIEIWTRHYCGTKIVDRVFYRIDLHATH